MAVTFPAAFLEDLINALGKLQNLAIILTIEGKA